MRLDQVVYQFLFRLECFDLLFELVMTHQAELLPDILREAYETVKSGRPVAHTPPVMNRSEVVVIYTKQSPVFLLIVWFDHASLVSEHPAEPTLVESNRPSHFIVPIFAVPHPCKSLFEKQSLLVGAVW